MSIYWKEGFYDSEIISIPEGAVEISQEEYLLCMKNQEAGLRLETDKSGKPVAVKDAEVTLDNLEIMTNTIVNAYLKEVVTAKGYDNVISAISYSGETKASNEVAEKFRLEGNAVKDWRTSVWSAAIAYTDKLKKKKGYSSTIAELKTNIINELPVINWPS